MTPEFDSVTHVYTVDGVAVPSVTQILKSVGIVSHDGADPERLATAAERGTLVHEATALLDRGDEVDAWDRVIGTDAEAFVMAWSTFREQSGFSPTLIEKPFACDKHGMRYAGTIDRVGQLNGAEYIIELKTSSRPQPWWGLQLMGYALALQQVARTPPRRAAVQLKSDGSYVVHEFSDTRDSGFFLAALALESWKRASILAGG